MRVSNAQGGINQWHIKTIRNQVNIQKISPEETERQPTVDKQFERGKFSAENEMTQVTEHSVQTQEESSKRQTQQPKKLVHQEQFLI